MADEAPITILVNGQAYTGWLDYRSKHSFDKCSGELDLTISPQPGVPMPMPGQQLRLQPLRVRFLPRSA